MTRQGLIRQPCVIGEIWNAMHILFNHESTIFIDKALGGGIFKNLRALKLEGTPFLI